PTLQQFTAYGSALANQDVTNADAQAAMRRFDQTLAFVVGIASGAVISGLAALAAGTIPAVSIAFAAMAGRLRPAAYGLAVGGAAWSLAAASATGVGVAAGLPAAIIIAVVVAVVGTVILVEDSQILPQLQTTLQEAYRPPDVNKMKDDDAAARVLL